MTVRARLICLLSLLAILFLVGALWLRSSEYQRVQQLLATDHREKTRFITKILDLKGASLEALAYDYTYWDEMVRFVGSRDPVWAKQNLPSALSTYKTDGIWIYTPQRRLVYSTCDSGRGALKHLPLTSGTLFKVFRGHHFCHFFVVTRSGVLEIRGAEIHATSDEKRVGKCFGYFLDGRIWNAEYLMSLSELTASRAVLLLAQPGASLTATDRDGNDVIDFYRILPDSTGRPVACVHLASASGIIRVYRSSTAHMMSLILLFITTFLALLSFCLLQWVSGPLRSLSHSLGTQDLSQLRPLLTQQTEFGALARLVERFSTQKVSLETEVAERRQIEQELQAAHDQLEARVATRTSELAEANQLLENAYTATIMGWSRAMDLRDHETEGHCQRVTEMTLRLAKKLGFSEGELVTARRGALLHDIGKMGVPDDILRKRGPLSDAEWVEMRRHPVYALEMLAPIEFLHTSLDIPWCHHEKWDGTGYPRGLAGEAIPLAARVFALVDVWDALRSDRPYRRGWPSKRVVKHIQGLAGTHFDPRIVAEFLALIETEGEAPGVENPECALAA